MSVTHTCTYTLTMCMHVLYDRECVCCMRFILLLKITCAWCVCVCVCNNLGRGLFLPEQSVGVLEVGWCSANEIEAKQQKMIQCLVYSSRHPVLKNTMQTSWLNNTQSHAVTTLFGCLQSSMCVLCSPLTKLCLYFAHLLLALGMYMVKKAADYSHINLLFLFGHVSLACFQLNAMQLFLERNIRDQMLHCHSSRFTIKNQNKGNKNAEIKIQRQQQLYNAIMKEKELRAALTWFMHVSLTNIFAKNRKFFAKLVFNLGILFSLYFHEQLYSISSSGSASFLCTDDRTNTMFVCACVKSKVTSVVRVTGVEGLM